MTRKGISRQAPTSCTHQSLPSSSCFHPNPTFRASGCRIVDRELCSRSQASRISASFSKVSAMFSPMRRPSNPLRETRSIGDDPSLPKCQTRRWLDMSRAWVRAAAASCRLSETSSSPRARRASLMAPTCRTGINRASSAEIRRSESPCVSTSVGWTHPATTRTDRNINSNRGIVGSTPGNEHAHRVLPALPEPFNSFTRPPGHSARPMPPARGPGQGKSAGERVSAAGSNLPVTRSEAVSRAFELISGTSRVKSCLFWTVEVSI